MIPILEAKGRTRGRVVATAMAFSACFALVRSGRADWTLEADGRTPEAIGTVARAGDHWLLGALRNLPGTFEPFSFRLDDDGSFAAPLEGTSIGLGTAGTYPGGPLVCGTTTCLAAQEPMRLLGLDGAPKSTVAFPKGERLAAVWTGTRYLVAYADSATGLTLATVDESGTVGTAHAFGTVTSRTTLAWNGTEAMVTDLASGGIRLRAVSADGVDLAKSVVVPWEWTMSYATAARGSGWAVGTGGISKVRLTLLDSKLATTSSFDFADSNKVVDVAAVGTQTWIAFGSSPIVGARVDAAGVLLDATPKTLTASPAYENTLTLSAGSTGAILMHPNATKSGTELIRSDVTLLGADMAPKKTLTHTAAPGQYAPSLATSGSTTMIAWNEYGWNSQNARIALVDATGPKTPQTIGHEIGGVLVPLGAGYLHVAQDLSTRLLFARSISSPGTVSAAFAVQPKADTGDAGTSLVDGGDASFVLGGGSAAASDFSVAPSPDGAVWVVWTSRDVKGPTPDSGLSEETHAVRIAPDVSIGPVRHLGMFHTCRAVCAKSRCWAATYRWDGICSTIVPFDDAGTYASFTIEAFGGAASVGDSLVAVHSVFAPIADAGGGKYEGTRAQVFAASGATLSPEWTLSTTGNPLGIAGVDRVIALSSAIDMGVLKLTAHTLDGTGPLTTTAIADGVNGAAVTTDATNAWVAWSAADPVSTIDRLTIRALPAPPPFGDPSDGGSTDATIGDTASDAELEAATDAFVDTSSADASLVDASLVDASGVDASESGAATPAAAESSGCAHLRHAASAPPWLVLLLFAMARRRAQARCCGLPAAGQSRWKN